MEIWADSVDLEEIREMEPKVMGVTTNPLLIKKNEKTKDLNTEQLKKHFIEIFRIMQNKPVFLQTVSLDSENIIKEGKAIIKFAKENGCSKIGLKIPLTLEGIKAIKVLKNEDCLILGTAAFNLQQIYLAGKENMNYSAIYTARATKHFKETGEGELATKFVKEALKLNKENNFQTKIMAANFRKGENEINEILKNNIDAITVDKETYEKIGDFKIIEEDTKLNFQPNQNINHPQVKKAMEDFTKAIEDNPAYLKMILQEASESEIKRILKKNREIIEKI